MNNLTCTCVPGLEGLSETELGRLFPEPSCAVPLLSLVQESGIDGFNLRSIVVLQDDVPVLCLPLFESRFDLSAFVEGWLKQALKVAGRLVPSIFQPRILCVGSLVGEWSEIGIAPHIDEDTLAAAFKMAFVALHTLAVERKSDITALYNFNHFCTLPGEVFETFNRVQYRSCAVLQIDFKSVEEYLNRLSRGARKDLRRKMRVAPEVRVVRSCTISPYLDRIYELYRETVARGPMALGVHSPLFFETICERVPGAEYTLYFVQDTLAAFNLLVVKPEAMVDKFFCMDFEFGRRYNLYVLSWIENIRTCLERKIPVYYAGQGTEKTKAHLGATFMTSYILFKHRRPLFDRLLIWPQKMTGKLLSRLGYWSTVSQPAGTEETKQVEG
jgi:uncharacterized protein